MDHNIKKRLVLRFRHRRIRRKVFGTAVRPRLSVSKSLKNIEAQLVDDVSRHSLLGLSSLSPQVLEKLSGVAGKCQKSKIVGQLLAEKALQAGIQQVVFDRGGHLYHGRIKALAEGAREGGLRF
jgi:large subunit ribosomal protein L18